LINKPKYTYRNVCNTVLHAFLAFGSISNTYIAHNHSHYCRTLVPPMWTNSEGPCFQTASEQEFGYSFKT